MINFFRKVRKKLADDNKPLKYMRYAIGEIVLVVIGILIALQINNWNDELKQRNLEIKILKEISGNLKLDLVEIRQDISIMDSVGLAGQNVILHMKTEPFPSESFYYDVAKLRVNPHFDPNKSGYSLLVSKGVEIIENDSLRGILSVLYESTYPYYYRYEEERTQFKVHQINPELLENFTWLPLPNSVQWVHASYQIPIEDYIELRNDQTFVKMVNAVIHENSVVQNRAQRLESRIVTVLRQLQDELMLKADQ